MLRRANCFHSRSFHTALYPVLLLRVNCRPAATVQEASARRATGLVGCVHWCPAQSVCHNPDGILTLFFGSLHLRYDTHNCLGAVFQRQGETDHAFARYLSANHPHFAQFPQPRNLTYRFSATMVSSKFESLTWLPARLSHTSVLLSRLRCRRRRRLLLRGPAVAQPVPKHPSGTPAPVAERDTSFASTCRNHAPRSHIASLTTLGRSHPHLNCSNDPVYINRSNLHRYLALPLV